MLDESQIQRLIGAVNFVSDDRMTNRGKVNPDLMRSACQWRGPNDTKFPSIVLYESFFDCEFRSGGGPGGTHSLLQPDWRGTVFALSSKRRAYELLVPVWPAARDGKVFLPDSVLLHRQTESPGGCARFCNQDQSARFTIEPVNDGNLATIFHFKSEQLAQFEPKRSRTAGLGGMDE